MSNTKLCRDCCHYRYGECWHENNLSSPDPVHGNARFAEKPAQLRSFFPENPFCGSEGLVWERKVGIFERFWLKIASA